MNTLSDVARLKLNVYNDLTAKLDDGKIRITNDKQWENESEVSGLEVCDKHR